jgi:hypothetical protein
MMRKNKKIVTIDLFVDFFMCFVFHIIRIIRRYTVDNDFLIELNGKSILVDSNLFDVVSASNLNSCFSYKVLDDNICHELSVSISFLIEAMNLIHVDMMKLNLSIVSTGENCFICWVHRC